MSRSPPTRVLLPADKTTAGDISERGGLAIAQSYVDMLSLARPGTAEKCSHDTVASVQPRGQISDSDADLDGRTVPAARDVHQTKLGLHHYVVPRPLGVRARLAIARDRSIDQPWVNLVYRIKVQLVLFERSRDVVLDKDIAPGRQLMQDLDAGWILERKGQRLFVAVHLAVHVSHQLRKAIVLRGQERSYS